MACATQIGSRSESVVAISRVVDVTTSVAPCIPRRRRHRLTMPSTCRVPSSSGSVRSMRHRHAVRQGTTVSKDVTARQPNHEDNLDHGEAPLSPSFQTSSKSMSGSAGRRSTGVCARCRGRRSRSRCVNAEVDLRRSFADWRLQLPSTSPIAARRTCPPAPYTSSMASDELVAASALGSAAKRSRIRVARAQRRVPSFDPGRTVSSGPNAGVADSVGDGDGLTVADELEDEAVGSGMSGFGSSSEHAPTRHAANSVASAQRVRIIRVHPREKRTLTRTYRRTPTVRDPPRQACG